MSVDLSKLIVKRKITLDQLNNKTIAIDAYNVLYQFLTIIRQPDGSPLVDSKGNVTSHLSGLFYRTIDLVSNGIKPIYVFDGIPSILKQKTIESRMKRRNDALEAWETAKKEGRMEEAQHYAVASTRINKQIVASAKELLDCMGIYHISAPSEGEAQASIMCKQKTVDAAGSQDYDTLLFGAPLVARNITISGRRKLPSKNVFVNIEPELVELKETLNSLGIKQEQLIWIGLMLGTDFNEGIKGIGPKTAMKIVKSSKSITDIKNYIKEKYKTEFELDPQEVIDLFEKPEVKEIKMEEVEKGLKLKPNKEKLISFMCDEHGFDGDRITKYADKLIDFKGSSRQQSIGSWF